MLATSVAWSWVDCWVGVAYEAFEFYKSLAGQAVYVTTLGFKRYAPLFYFQQPNDHQAKRKDIHWLLTGDIDKPAYFVVKVTN